MKRLAYIAGPYTNPDPCENTRLAVDAGDRLLDVCAPVIPHLSHFWHTMSPKPYEVWLALDIEYLARCDALLRLPGESSGADKEVAWAEEHGIPVFYDEAKLREWCGAADAPLSAPDARPLFVFKVLDAIVTDSEGRRVER